MALNREIHPIQDGSVPKFGEFHWNQQVSVKPKRSFEPEIDSGQASPKKIAIELTSDDEGGSSVATQICNLVEDDDDDDYDEQEEHPAVAYLNNGVTVQVYEVPQDTENGENSVQEDGAETINGFPTYQLQRNVPFLNETLQLCMGTGLDQRFICSQVPMNIHETALFIVDFQCVRHHDVVARDRGSFGRQSSPTRHVAVKVLPDGTIEDIKTVKIIGADNVEPGYEFYKIRRHYTWHKYIPGLSRIITRLEYKNVLFRYGVVQFKLAEEDRSFTSNFKPQQVPKEKVVHVQRGTPRSSLDRRVQAETSSELNSNRGSSHDIIVTQSTSALNSSQSSSSTPRETIENSSAVAAHAHREQRSTTSSDVASCKSEIFHILQNADKPKPLLSTWKVPDFSKLLFLLKCEDFLCDVSFNRMVNENARILNPRTFAMGELQKHWLKTYCTGNNPKSVVSISTRYKIADHYLTTLTCSLPIFVLRDHPSAKHPTVLLGLMTSLTNKSEDYEYLASNLLRQGVTQMVYGTDGNYSLDAALERNFPLQEQHSSSTSSTSEKSVHLCCFEKIREDISQKLDELNVKKPDSKTILRQIFGSAAESERTSNDSLVDQKSEGKFREMLTTAEKKWPVAFRNWFTNTTENTDRSMSETIKKCMLRPVRTAAGLGNSPVRYSNRNNSKCLGDAVAELESSDSVDLVKIHEVIKLKAVESQITDFVKAMYNMGDLRLAKAYQHLKVSLVS